MKEIRFFYAPDALTEHVLPADEASHALRVLRLREGDSLNIIDGQGNLIEATIAEAGKHVCRFNINRVEGMPRPWPCGVHLAVAPTKNIDRMEWLVEKATEIGVDSITFLDCANSERRVIKTERLDKIAVAAMKQSHKYYKPQINDMVSFRDFVKSQESHRSSFIAHCYDDADLLVGGSKPFLLDAIREHAACRQDMLVLVGPEGDFSPDEVRLAISEGYIPVSLGQSRLRTETAGLVAVHLMQLATTL